MLSKFSVKKPYTIIVAVVMVLLLGTISFSKTSTDLLPELELPYAVIYTSYPGASSEKVENNVTKVIENSIGTTENLLNVTSTSYDNLSLVMLEFAEDSNMDRVMLDLQTKLSQAKAYLDDACSTPSLMAINPNMLPVMMTTIDYENKDLQELSDFVEKDIVKEIKKSKGVASVSMDGVLKETLQITFKQDAIDDINNKIINSVNHELAKADMDIKKGLNEVNEALDKINNGEKELVDKKNETFDSLANTSVRIDELKSTLISMNQQLTELKAEKMAFEGIVTTLQKQAEEAGFNDVKEFIADLNIKKVAIEESVKVIDEAIKALNNNPDLKDIIIEQLIKIPSLQDKIDPAMSNEELINVLEEAKNEISKGLEAIIQGLQMCQKYDEAIIRLEQLPIEIATCETIVNTTCEELRKLGINPDDLGNIKEQIESGKLQATNEFTKGELALTSSKETLLQTKKELEKALTELNNSKEEALKSANIDSLLNSEMLSNILMAENFNMPAGYLQGEDSLLIKVGDEFKSLDELKNLKLLSMDIAGLENIYLSDVADVVIVNNSDEIYTKVNGNNALIMTIQKNSTASTSDVTHQLNALFKDLENEYEGLHFTSLMDQGVYIDTIIDSVLDNFIYGGILAIIVLLIFLKDIKPTLIIAMSIPISFMFALILMYFSKVSINIISLSGLALGVGMLVDNSVVVLENIYRLKSEGKDIINASIEGAKQVSMSIIASTLTTVCVFLPIVFTEGLTRQLFVDMGLTIAYSLFASLIVALTLVPMLSSKMLKKTKEKKHYLYDKLVNAYQKGLIWSLNHRLLVLTIVLILFITSIFGVSKMGLELLPAMESNQLQIAVKLNDEELDKENRHLIFDQILNDVKDVYGVKAIGVSESKDQESADTISFYVVTDENQKMDLIKDNISLKLDELPIKYALNSNQMDVSALGTSGIVMYLYHDDLDVLKDSANEVKEVLLKIDGIKEVNDGQGDLSPELRIIIDKNSAMEYGLTVAQIYQEIAKNIKTETSSTSLTIENKEYPVVIIKDGYNSVNELTNMIIQGNKGKDKVDVVLSDIASFENDLANQSINRDNSRRYTTVNATIEDGYNVALVSREVEKIITDDYFSNGVDIEYDGENETIMEAMVSILQMILLAISFIYMIMVAQFQSLKAPFIVMFTIPLAFTGGLLALFITKVDLSVVSMLGFLVLSGVVVNNGIVLIDYVNQLRASGMSNYDSLIEAGKTRLRPILMTALTTILAMFTMALGVGSGASMMQGMAIVTIGGLSYATLLTLFVVPILISLMDKQKKDLSV